MNFFNRMCQILRKAQTNNRSENRMNFIPRTYAALMACVCFSAAQVAIAEDDSNNIVEEKIRGLVPNAKTIAISETPIDNVLQVQINSDIVYVSGDGQYLIQGQIMDIETRTNITDQAKSGIRQDLLANLNVDEQISFSPEKAKYDLLVFTDIDCGYCRKLHNQVEEYNEEGIAIHYLAFPRAGVGSESYDKFVSVWCADDQKAALTLAKNGDDP
ncbi:MAG: thioredoxin fold domain-containing protein, partial [Xanthomonadales bacterium]|nr:thioredoxin fold domain-containing protein [Xanthomonadales bacterium]